MNEQEKKLMGVRIKELRGKNGLSQEGLADSLGMKRTNVANYEAGRVIPPGNVLLDMSKIFNVSTDYILGKTLEDHQETPTPIKTWLRQGNTDLTDSETEELSSDLEEYFHMRKRRIMEDRKRNKGD